MQPSRIVGIGASAGGLESLEQLFTELSPTTGMAFVIVQHLSPDFRSLMDELIARRSTMPVEIADDGMAVEADHVYVMPPRKEMIIRDRRLVLTDKVPSHGFTLPIDQFFRSLAQDIGAQAVAVVLSGSGSDGSRGLIDVKRAGGTVFAETSASARFDGMPLSAQATGAVDRTGTPGDIARILSGLEPVDVAPRELLSDDPPMDAILRLLHGEFGIDFSLYKPTTVTRRIQRRLDLRGIADLEAYAEELARDPEELNALYQDLLIGVTQFFRDPEAYEALERHAIPQLLDKIPPTQEIRLWVAGCATGEEAYSIAMLFHDALVERQRPINLKILATDVHQVSLDRASTGIYGENQLVYVTPPRLERYFTRRTTGYQVSADLRQLIVFARHNVTKDAPFTKMHFVSCRNMLIYFEPHAQRTVLSLFHFGLAPGGILFLGASESPGALSDEFVALDEHWKIFRKRRDIQLLSQLRVPLGRRPVPRLAADVPRIHAPDPQILATYDQLLDRYMPPSFLVDEDRTLIDSFAGAERLLKLKRRRPSAALLDLLEGELRTVASTAIQRALKDNSRAEYTGVTLHGETGEHRATVVAEPFVHPRTDSRHVLLSIQPQAASSSDEPRPGSVTEASRERMDSLESELGYMRETLQSTIEELETSNEEMQATNEELVASNEELQSTNEELHSVNEELYSVNAEYQHKIVELKELNADVEHLLEGTDVGTMFLDGDLRIRRFTSRIAAVFHITTQDIGRSIRDFSHELDRPSLVDEVERVHHEGAMVEDEVADRDGRRYLLRILPYAADAREGVVVTLIDISMLARTRSRVAELSAIVESSDDAIIGKTRSGTITSWNRGAERLYGYMADEAIGQHVSMLADGPDRFPQFVDTIVRGEAVEHVQLTRRRKDGSRVEVSMSVSPIRSPDDELVGVSGISRDITPLVTAQRELEAAARRREQFLAMLSHELRNPLAAVLNAASLLAENPQAGERCAAIISRQAAHMARLLDDLLDVSRIAIGKLGLRRQEIDLRRCIELALESTAPLLLERAIDVRVDIAREALPVLGDPNRLQQVVMNLLSNAANYSQRGSRIDVHGQAGGDHAEVRVIDRGMGIEPEMLDRIFELFVQSEQHLDRPRGGLGVGLSLARSIVELHGGTITASSDGLGRGSAFVVRLPLRCDLEAQATEAPAKLRPCRIVLVEDQQDSREILRMLLEHRDHVVVDASDGAAAVEMIEREHPDAALIDIGLPVMDGYEVAQHVRKHAHLDDVLLVALTGYGAPTDIAAARAAGFDEHVIKPVELARIEEILARRLNRASQT